MDLKWQFCWAGAMLASAMLVETAVFAAANLGTNRPAMSLTRERIDSLPAKEKREWLAYLKRSQVERQADKDRLHREMAQVGLTTPIQPAHGNSARSVPLDRDAAWYARPDATHIADVIVSFQTPAGGWGKNLDMSKEVRQPGEAFTATNLSLFLSAGDFDAPLEPDWNYVGTIDNDATTTQLAFLVKVIAATGRKPGGRYEASFLHGLNYLFKAQFPNGGWPQVWPLEGGYHDAITYNDDAMIHVMELMGKVGGGGSEFGFVPKKDRLRAESSFVRGIRCILATQIMSGGTLSVWPQRDDALTLKPVAGRNFEPPAASAAESSGVLLFLMNAVQNPSEAERNAIRAGAAWLKKTAIYNRRWERGGDGRGLVVAQGSGTLWARYYQIGTDLPIFADRDKSIYDDVNDLSKERRNGYAWYSSDAQRALERFDTWTEEHPEK